MRKATISLAKRLGVLMFVITAATSSLIAVPAYPGWLRMTQPDGSTIEVRHVGDEFYHYSIDREGRRVQQDASGWWRVSGEVPSAEAAQARHAVMKARKSPRRAPQAVGTEPNLAPKGVVILANFKDSKMQSSHTQAVFDELCNSTNCTVNKYNGVNYGSAAQYFADQSNGTYRPQFDVYGPVTLSRDVAYYGTDKPGEDEGDDQHATDAVVEACILANQEYSDLNFANYDSDGDGYVDFVYVIYAGQGQADGGATTTIWPHNWEVESAIYYGYCTYTSSQCKVDGKKLNNYAMSGELSGSSLGGIGTLCHEFGHVMGLPDFYDTQYGSNYSNGVTPGKWNIMDGGSYNGDGHCPPNYDPWEKYFFGWVTPVNLASEGQNITLYANGTSSYQSYQINSSNNLQSATTEGLNYYIENRQKSGWDKFVPESGMLVWVVNFNASAWSNNSPNNTAGSPRYTIVPADGKKKDYGASGDTYPTSSVRSYTPISGHAMTEITRSGNNITFKYNGGQQKTECSYELLAEHCTAPADGVVATNSTLSLTITPDAGYTLADPACWTVEMGTANELVYGEGFTYNPTTHEFRIEKVTDDVVIMAEAKEQVSLSWMSNGSLFMQTVSAGSVVLPEEAPTACEGKVFVGWTTVADYEHASIAPAFVQTGDAATVKTFYAVFATQGEGGGSVTESYTFTTKSWAESTNTWTGTSDGNQYTNGQGIQVTTGKTGAGAKTSQSFSNVIQAVVTYCTNASKGSGSIDVTIGSTTVSHDVTSTGGTTLRDLEFDFNNISGTAAIQVNCDANSIYIHSIAITTGGGANYSDYTTVCSTEPEVPVYYTIRFFSNGEKLSENQILKGSVAETPAAPNACGEYIFAGWLTTPLSEDVTEAPAFASDFTATKDQDYYAVFSLTEEGEGGASTSVEDVLDKAFTGVSGTSYTAWSGKTSNSGAVYAGQSAGGNESIQLRSNNNNSGIITTVSGGKATKITVDWNANTSSGRTLDIYGKNSAYESAADLYGANAGTKIGSIASGSQTELVITGDFAYIGMRSASGAMYINSVTVTWSGSGNPGSTTYYTTSPVCEECTSSVTVKKGTSEHGSFQLDYVGELNTCGGAVTVTVTATPDTYYRFKEITQTGVDDVTIDQEAKTVTYAKKSEGESTIHVVFEEKAKYTVRFHVNGVIAKSEDLYEGTVATAPTNPEVCKTYRFEGWSTGELAEGNTAVPTLVSDFTVTQDQDYFAVFSLSKEAEGGEGSAPVDDRLTNATTGISGNSYSNWSGKTLNSGAVYAGQSAGGNESIQLRSKNSESGIVTTVSGGKVTKVTVEWNNNTSGRTLDIYGKNSAYESAADLYGANAGTQIGSIDSDTETELTVEGDYEYIGVRSNNGALYMDAITFTWSVAGGSSSVTYYSTTIDCSEDGTQLQETITVEPKAEKLIRNGQLLIIRDGKAYNAQGLPVY